MKTQIRSLLTVVCAVSASLLLIVGSPAQAGYIVTLQQVGSNVVATGSGTIDTTDLAGQGGGGGFQPLILPSIGSIFTGTPGIQSFDFFIGVSGPNLFGGGGQTIASSGSGDFVGMNVAPIGRELMVPPGYVSGNPLSDTSTYDGATLASLGVTPGTYVWTWGTGAHADSFTLETVAPAVPDTGSTFGLLSLALAALFGASRFRALRLA